MLYLTCTTITRVDLAHYGVSRAKDWVSVDCGTKTNKSSVMSLYIEKYKLLNPQKFTSAKFCKLFYPSYIELRIPKLEGKHCRSI